MKRKIFLFCFSVEKFDQNSFGADKKEMSNSGTPNMKSKAAFQMLHLSPFHFILLERPKWLNTI